MKCPYCENEMTKGYISNRDGIYWSEKRHILPTALEFGKDKKIDLSPQSNHAEAFICEKCKKVIIEY